MGVIFTLLYLAFLVLIVVGGWKVFAKAGQPGWASLIPIFNVYVALLIAKRPAWWLLLFLIPGVNFIIYIIMTLDIARKFGQSIGFAIGMILLPGIFWTMLGFGDAQYSPEA